MDKPTKDNKGIVEAINDLMNDSTYGRVFQPGDPNNSHKIETIDLYPVFKHKLTPEARNILEGRKAYSLFEQRNEENVDANPKKNFLKFLHNTGNQGVTQEMLDGLCQYTRVIDRVHCLGKMSTLNKIEVAADKVCNGLNKLAKRGYITSTLAPLIGVKLQKRSAREKPKMIVTSYVAIDYKHEDYLEKLKGLTFEEGGVPSKV